jgi:hypothetical protein
VEDESWIVARPVGSCSKCDRRVSREGVRMHSSKGSAYAAIDSEVVDPDPEASQGLLKPRAVVANAAREVDGSASLKTVTKSQMFRHWSARVPKVGGSGSHTARRATPVAVAQRRAGARGSAES